MFEGNGTVASFSVDHTKLKPGLYVSQILKFGETYLTVYDFRFCKPNAGHYLSNPASHTIEHSLAAWYSANHKDKVYFGPMGCLTGFYLVLAGKHDVDYVKADFPAITKYLAGLKEVPGATEKTCGNYRMHSLEQARAAWQEYLKYEDNNVYPD